MLLLQRSALRKFHVTDGQNKRDQTQAAQAHYMNADVTLACACERCCVTNGYLQRLVWDVNGFS